MSETNLIDAKYALDLRNVRVSLSHRDKFSELPLSIDEKGLIDLSEFNQLSKFSSYLQKDRSINDQKLLSSGNLNLFMLNDRVRLRMIEIFSDLLDINLLHKIRDYWVQEDNASKEKVERLFQSEFFEKSGDVSIDELLRFWFSYNNRAHLFYSNEFYGENESLEEISSTINDIIVKIKDELPEIDGNQILEFLLTPEKLHPESIKDQINYMVSNWQKYLSKEELNFLLLAKDLITEEEKFRGFGGPGPSEIYEFGGNASFQEEGDYEAFSQDQHWMPRLVLLAKNVYVWLDQLSKKYRREISTLSDIPEKELDILSSRGISGLWLVGIWERSPASKKIKNLTGNLDVLASAYSIYDYEISKDLGGEDAFNHLKKRLKKRNIRIGADMVPNHMGIDSKWIRDHPEWFIKTENKPFDSYSYEGEDLSESDKIEIYLEDHYYDKTDAAVTFKRVDKNSGEVSYVYHGNDGTSFPWNDTAQIDFLNEEAREAVIQTIVDVAKKFPIIRFDAAMVLAKQHIRRLWYPAPGEGGDIPSRSLHSMSDEEFNDAIPQEFWREVVDRVNSEAPDTLLLAEAFWLLEGYFVRTLGMHRVYNSAFMKMLHEEENSKYRQTIKNVLEYDPEILQRFVNYLTTPDEEAAVEVFGTGDKYFGLATMMATMPGLPMFGHGQFEGLSEKYGMEYSQSRMNEDINYGLIDRHELEIVPLLKKRYLFSGSQNFYLYDFFTAEGAVNEDVFAYSNRYDGEKALVIYNNNYDHAAGWVKRSVAFSEKLDDKTTRLRQVDLFKGLDLSNGDGYLLFKDHVTGLEYIRSKEDILEKGLYVEVGAFKYHVFVDLKEVYDNQGIWSRVSDELEGKGVSNLQEIYNKISQTESQPEEIEEPLQSPAEEEDKEILSDDSLTRLKVELAELKEENIALKGQIEALDAEISTYKDESQQISQLRDQNNALRKQLDESSSGSVGREKSEKEIQQLKNVNEKLRQKIDQLEAHSDILEAKTTELKSENLAIRSERQDQSEIDDLKNENKELNNQLAKEISANAELEKDLNFLKSRVSELEDKLEEERTQNEKLSSQLDQLHEEKVSLEEDLASQKQDTQGSYSSGETLLSSVLLETIKTRLEDARSGIKLRNLAMSLGISASVCLSHVETMEKKGQVHLKYGSTDDSNPLVTSTTPK